MMNFFSLRKNYSTFPPICHEPKLTAVHCLLRDRRLRIDVSADALVGLSDADWSAAAAAAAVCDVLAVLSSSSSAEGTSDDAVAAASVTCSS